MKKIRIKLQSFDHVVLEKAVSRICKKAITTGAVVRGPIPLPTKKKIFTVRRSPHVNEDSRDQFVIKTFKRIIEIHLSSLPESTIEGLMRLDLPSNVNISLEA